MGVDVGSGASFLARVAPALGVAGGVWVTDADGTLWRDDIGEAFLRSLADRELLVAPDARGVDVWESYERRVAENTLAGYVWAVQAMAGLREEAVIDLARSFAADFLPPRIYEPMRALVDETRRRGCTPWIVSASNHWLVQAAAPFVGIDPSHAIGLRLAVRDGVLTREPVEPVTWRAGKAEAIERFIGVTPALVSGDAMGDFEMMNSARAALLVVHEGRTDPALLAHARECGWMTWSFDP